MLFRFTLFQILHKNSHNKRHFRFYGPYSKDIDTKFTRLVPVSLDYIYVKFAQNNFKYSNVIKFCVILM